MATVNEELLDRQIRHQTFLERLKTSERNKILAFLNREVYPDARERLTVLLDRAKTRGFDSRKTRTQALARALERTEQILTLGLSQATGTLTDDLFEIGQMELAWDAKRMREVVTPLTGVELGTPSLENVRAAITTRPFEGRLLRGWYRTLDVSVRSELRRQVQLGISSGESTGTIVRRVAGSQASSVFNSNRRSVEAIVRTAINHTTTQTRERFYEENEDVIERVQWVSTLDSRTTVICAGLDGQTFKIGRGPRPPIHINCRSTTVPVVSSFSEFPGLKDPPPSTRASLDGQVPDKLTYPEWLRTQSRGVQNEVLGPTRARLWREGKITIDRFTDQNNRPLNLEQLAKREGLSENDIKIERASSTR